MKLALVTVLASSGSENVAATLVLVLILLAALAGFVLFTVGGVVSAGGAAAVLKLQLYALASGLPARSFTPLICAV
jgi:hypothetical protein